jgi:ABC-type lipoprotein release transport system permease subunit
MGVVWFRVRAELRAKWRTVVVLALVAGIGGGIALTAIAGARRTDAAMPGFVAYSLPDDGGFLFGSVTSPPVTTGATSSSATLVPIERRVVELPQVAAYFQAPYLFMATNPAGRNAGGLNPIGATNAALYRRVDRPKVVAGRLPDPTHPFDVAVNELAAAKDHLRVGSPVRLYAYSLAQFQRAGLTNPRANGPSALAGPSFTVRVTGIVRFPQDVNAIRPLAARQDVSYEGQQNLYLSPAFLPRLAAGLGIGVQSIPDINLVGVRLRHGAADWKAFSAAATALGHGAIFTSAGNVYGIRTAASSAQRGIHLEVVALLLFGAIAALVTLLLVGHAVARQVMLEGDNYATMRALGVTRAQLMAIVVARASVIGAAGGALAFVVAVLGSPLMPLGLARQAELHLGFDVDLTVLVPGVFIIVVLIAARSTLPAWRVSRLSAASPGDGLADARVSRVGDAVARRSPVAGIGVRFGLEPGRGRQAVPLVSAMAGAVVAVAALAAALTFGASLGRLLDSPRQQGWNWDVLVGNPNTLTDQEARAGPLLAHNRLIGGYSAIAILAGASQGNVVIDGKVVNLLIAIDPLKGSVYPPLLEGHAPRASNEIVLGSGTLEKLNRHIGQSVRIGNPSGGPPFTLRIVGRMISPSVGDLFTNGIGDGGWAYGPAVRQMQAQTPPSQNSTPPTVFSLFAVRYARGAPPAAAFASLRRDFGATVLRQLPSQDVVNLQSVDRLPSLLAGLVVLLGIATVGNTLVASVRERRRDLAILKTIGFVRRQVAGVVAWQATSFCLVALVVGLPVGIAGGRWAWDAVASGISSASAPLVPIIAIIVVVPAALVVANAVAAWPGRAAARVAPAVAMRSE